MLRGLGVLLALVVVGAATAETLTGRVVSVSDGDTLTLLTADRQRVKIRLAEIDAPEHDQPFGSRSKQSLSQLAFNKTVTVEVRAHDDYGRTVGVVFVAGQSLDAEQVRRGMAWVYRQYATTPSLYTLEAEAKAARRGLWADSNPLPPWDWRHGEAPKPAISAARNDSCGSKHRCGEMASCAEARFYLDTCGVKSLDGDKDGMPCESLCAGQ
ncbi:MAG: thermonuclease family protein [Candidatus Competibacteraceae bacterium]|nr:thermonuclease family protein [Candidatus Competibacteraceae bacterium]